MFTSCGSRKIASQGAVLKPRAAQAWALAGASEPTSQAFGFLGLKATWDLHSHHPPGAAGRLGMEQAEWPQRGPLLTTSRVRQASWGGGCAHL